MGCGKTNLLSEIKRWNKTIVKMKKKSSQIIIQPETLPKLKSSFKECG
jgi:hypothetical protein